MLLAVDTSSKTGSLSIHDPKNGAVLTSSSWEKQKSHSEVITVHLEQALNELSITARNLTKLAVGIGPGSFTGIRVGINLVRGLGFALDLPIYTLDSLRVLAEPAKKYNKPVLCFVNAFKNMAYVAVYSPESNMSELLKPQAFTLQQLQSHLNQPEYTCIGDGFSAFQNDLPAQLKTGLIRYPELSDVPLAEQLGLLCCCDQGLAQVNEWKQVKPLYIRASEAEEKLSRGLLKPLPKI